MDRGSDAGLPGEHHGVMVEHRGIDSQERGHGEVIVSVETAVDAGGRGVAGTAEFVEAVVGVDAAGDVALRGAEVEAVEAVDGDGVAAAAVVVAVVFAEAFAMTVRLAWNVGPCWAIRRDENLNGRVF